MKINSLLKRYLIHRNIPNLKFSLEKMKLNVHLVRDIDKLTNFLGQFIVSYPPGMLKMHFWFIWTYNYDKFSVICGTIFIKPKFFYLRKIWRQNEYQICKIVKIVTLSFTIHWTPLLLFFAKNMFYITIENWARTSFACYHPHPLIQCNVGNIYTEKCLCFIIM